jgi:hypothetical protein
LGGKEINFTINIGGLTYFVARGGKQWMGDDHEKAVATHGRFTKNTALFSMDGYF